MAVAAAHRPARPEDSEIDTPPTPRTIVVKLGTYSRNRQAALIHRSPTPPTSPNASDDIAICRAWIDAELTHPGDQAAVVAIVETAVRRCLDRRAGRVGANYQRIPVGIRPLVGRRDGEGLKSLIGRWERGGFMPGVAQLTEAEAMVYWWDLRGWQEWEMQRELTAPKARMDRMLWVKAAVVERDLVSARVKVGRVFGL